MSCRRTNGEMRYYISLWRKKLNEIECFQCMRGDVKQCHIKVRSSPIKCGMPLDTVCRTEEQICFLWWGTHRTSWPIKVKSFPSSKDTSGGFITESRFFSALHTKTSCIKCKQVSQASNIAPSTDKFTKCFTITADMETQVSIKGI